VTSHGFVFTVTPDELPIFVALVTGYVDYRTRLPELSEGFKKVNRSHDIGGIGFNRIVVAATHDRLRRHVDDHLRAALGDDRLEPREIPDVHTNGADGGSDPGLLEQIWLCRGIKRAAGDLCSKGIEPQREPASLETRMSGDKDVATLPEFAIKHDGSKLENL